MIEGQDKNKLSDASEISEPHCYFSEGYDILT